jgi:SAM-dependent methyltransferase
MSPLQSVRPREAPRRLEACPICSSHDLEYAFVVEKYPVCQCSRCSLLFLNPQPPLVERDPSGIQVSEGEKEEARKTVDRLLSYSRTEVRNVLIIQGDTPFLESEVTGRGMKTVVLSPLRTAELTAQADNVFDACIFHGSLEQVPQPLELLETVRRVLKPEGALVVDCASVDSLPARIMRNRWWEFSTRRYFYFGVDTLQSLLLKAGFGDPIVHAAAADPVRWRDRIVLGLLGKRMRRYLDNRLTILARPKEMSATPKLSVIVPAFNEKATFSQLIDLVLNKQIENVDIEIIIVESNSTDGTREDVLKHKDHPRVKVILQERPRGKGNAVRAGLAHATGDVVLFQDSDLEYDINDYETLIWPILAYEQNFVIGSRHKGQNGTWKIRKFTDSAGLSHFFNFGHVLFLTLFNRIYHQNLADPFSMFKVFRRDCLYGLEFECNRFDFDFEIAIKLLRKGYRPVEIPINYQSRSISEGKKVTMFRDPLTWVRALLRFRKSPLYGEKGKRA